MTLSVFDLRMSSHGIPKKQLVNVCAKYFGDVDNRVMSRASTRTILFPCGETGLKVHAKVSGVSRVSIGCKSPYCLGREPPLFVTCINTFTTTYRSKFNCNCSLPDRVHHQPGFFLLETTGAIRVRDSHSHLRHPLHFCHRSPVGPHDHGRRWRRPNGSPRRDAYGHSPDGRGRGDHPVASPAEGLHRR